VGLGFGVGLHPVGLRWVLGFGVAVGLPWVLGEHSKEEEENKNEERKKKLK
jgi:hypothetical protein